MQKLIQLGFGGIRHVLTASALQKLATEANFWRVKFVNKLNC